MSYTGQPLDSPIETVQVSAIVRHLKIQNMNVNVPRIDIDSFYDEVEQTDLERRLSLVPDHHPFKEIILDGSVKVLCAGVYLYHALQPRERATLGSDQTVATFTYDHKEPATIEAARLLCFEQVDQGLSSATPLMSCFRFERIYHLSSKTAK